MRFTAGVQLGLLVPLLVSLLVLCGVTHVFWIVVLVHEPAAIPTSARWQMVEVFFSPSWVILFPYDS